MIMNLFMSCVLGIGLIALPIYAEGEISAHIVLNDDPEVSEDILAIEGDPAYGEYLSATCVTCHQIDGANKGIPSITNWPQKRFVIVMHAYKNKDRENPVMQQYAGGLSDEEIAALAAYFETIEN